MLNIRSIVLSVVVLLSLMLTASLLFFKEEVVPDSSKKDLSQSHHSVFSRDHFMKKNVDAWDEKDPTSLSQPALDACFDVSLSEVAACRDASQEGAQRDRAPLDECFDVSIGEAASCRNASQASTP